MCPQRSCSDGSAACSGTLSAGVATPNSFPLAVVWQDPVHLRAVHTDRQHRRILAILGWIRCLEPDDGVGAETALNVLATCVRRHVADGQGMRGCQGDRGGGGRYGEHGRLLAELRGCREQLDEGRHAGIINALERIGSRFARHLEEDDRTCGQRPGG